MSRQMTLPLFTILAASLVQADISAQTQPVVLTLKGIGFGSGGTGTDVQVVGNSAFWTWSSGKNGGFDIFDVTNPGAPVRVAGYETGAAVNAIHVAGRYAYLATGSVRTLTNDPGAFEIIDLIDPTNPVRVGGKDTPGRANDIHVAGNYAYVPEGTRWTGSNLLGALEILDVSTPTNPIRIATYDTDGSATSVAVSGGHAFLADGWTDLQVLDVSKPSEPKRSGGYDIDERILGAEFGGPARSIQLDGDLVYSSGENGFHILDITEPAHPHRVDGFNLLPVYAFHGSSNLVCAAIYSSHENSFRVFVYDANEARAGGDLVLGWPRSIQIVGRNLFVAADELYIYEITDVPAIKSIARMGTNVVVTWNPVPGFRLQRAVSLDDPLWTDIPSMYGQSRVELPILSGNEFFRLARP
jgi:hypothetical protein